MIVEYGGAGSGKSHFVVQKMIIKGLREKRRILVVRKVGRTLRESIFKLFQRVLSPIRPAVRSINKTDMTITLVNGTEFIFSGLDDAEKIKSIDDIDDVVIEEATELLESDFTQLRLRLRSKGGQNPAAPDVQPHQQSQLGVQNLLRPKASKYGRFFNRATRTTFTCPLTM